MCKHTLASGISAQQNIVFAGPPSTMTDKTCSDRNPNVGVSNTSTFMDFLGAISPTRGVGRRENGAARLHISQVRNAKDETRRGAPTFSRHWHERRNALEFSRVLEEETSWASTVICENKRLFHSLFEGAILKPERKFLCQNGALRLNTRCPSPLS